MSSKRSDVFSDLKNSFECIIEKQVLFKLYFGPNTDNDTIVGKSYDIKESAEMFFELIRKYRYNMDIPEGIKMYEKIRKYDEEYGNLFKIVNTDAGEQEIKTTNKIKFQEEISSFSEVSRKY